MIKVNPKKKKKIVTNYKAYTINVIRRVRWMRNESGRVQETKQNKEKKEKFVNVSERLTLLRE